MSDLVAMSFDCLSSPSLELNNKEGEERLSGWGYGWYPNDDNAVCVVKDAGAKDHQNLASTLSDWSRFRSTVFLCKVRGAAKRNSQQDTQPFQRSFGGREWLFLHNGDLDKEKVQQLLGNEEGFLAPMGSTDSEIAFCYILQQLRLRHARRIADIPWQQYNEWFGYLDALGSADFVFSDGHDMIVFHGTKTTQSLYYSRRVPPHGEENRFETEAVSLDFSDPLDVYRSSFIVTSVRFSGNGWKEMAPGQLLVVRRSSIHWDSHFMNSSPSLPPTQVTSQLGYPLLPATNKQSGPIVMNTKSITRSGDGRTLEYRRYKVSHLTEFNYDRNVERSTHVIRLQPVEDFIQEVVRSTLSVSVQGEQLQFEDVFGNQSMHLTLDSPYRTLAIKIESELKVYARPSDYFDSPMRRTSIPLVWMPWQRQMMLPYLLPTELPESQLLELYEFALSFVERGDYNLIDTLNEMNRSIFRDFSYVQGHTNLTTTPFEVYTSRKGVCQDFANLFICLARLLNIPARYRVGYIFTGANYDNKLQSEASHAWAEVYLPYLGWRGFDPTNGCTVGQDHIRIACGRNFRDAAPTTGTIYKGGGTETLSVAVKVKPTQKRVKQIL